MGGSSEWARESKHIAESKNEIRIRYPLLVRVSVLIYDGVYVVR